MIVDVSVPYFSIPLSLSQTVCVCICIWISAEGVLPIWMSTTSRPDMGTFDLADYGTQAASSLGYPVLDRRAITEAVRAKVANFREDVWYDHCHLQSYVYTEINNALLNLLCMRSQQRPARSTTS